MECKYLQQALPFLADIDKDRREQFEQYFETAPLWLLESIQIERLGKDVIFTRENTPVDTIYFIGKGRVKAIDYRIYGIAYDFMRFDKVYALGGMEIIMDLKEYCTTLATITPCTIAKIPNAKFDKGLKTNIRALRNEAKLVGEYLLEQSRRSRAYLFLQGADRLAMFFIEEYEKYAKKEVLTIRETRQELSDATGLCVRTINRAVKKFEEQGDISRQGNKLLISWEQYQKLKAVVSSIIGQA